jgi:hypothetical protein
MAWAAVDTRPGCPDIGVFDYVSGARRYARRPHPWLLAASTVAEGRVAASATLAALAKLEPRPELLSLDLTLANDDDAEVQSNAGAALVSFAERPGDLSEIALRKVFDLLDSDGILTPLMTLHAIATSSSPSDSPADALVELLARAEAMAAKHPSRSVRIEASKSHRKLSDR